MAKVVDIVNLNADASCLDSGKWLKKLEGGDKSEVYQFFLNYVETDSKISLGITGATLADIWFYNQECIELINQNRQLFEIIARPFSHDIALLRGRPGFLFNVMSGEKAISSVFGDISSSYLPPEFMLTNSQIPLLADCNMDITFINAARYGQNGFRIPSTPYELKGTKGSSIGCIPIDSQLTKAYLNSIHHYTARDWNRFINENQSNVLFSWRDGESPFLIPDGISRERAWLEDELDSVERVFISELQLQFSMQKGLELFNYQPVHSFSAWMKEFRMMYFVQHLLDLEKDFVHLTKIQKQLWLYLINSDILSAVEKNSPIIKMINRAGEEYDYTILRAEKNIEGDELLELIKMNDNQIEDYLNRSSLPFAKKLKARIQFINEQGIF